MNTKLDDRNVGVKDASGVDQAIENGATLITCNNPDVILELLRERGRHK